MISERPAQVIQKLSRFLNDSLESILAQPLDLERHVLALFKQAATEVPAYADFLKLKGIERESIRSLADFQNLPLMSKQDYMQVYPLAERCRQGSLVSCDRLAVSSGSTGTPSLWPRAMTDELDIALRFEQVFKLSFKAHERSTLAVVCFPMGNWVGGVYTASCCWHLAQKGYPLTVATPGNNPLEILSIVKRLSSQFEQTVLLGYPPFIKDVLDLGLSEGIRWPELNIKLVFAGEVFSEEWRDLMAARIGSSKPCFDFSSLYGTADAGVLGSETPISIEIRRFLAAHPEAARALFGESRLPTLVQYDPFSRYLEFVDGTLLVTADNGVPLIRYHLADKGGRMDYPDMLDCLRGFGFESKWSEGACQQPFAWVFGRADFTVSYYGANIFPEHIMLGLERPEFNGLISSKFVMEVKFDDKAHEYIHIVIECLPDVTLNDSQKKAISQSILFQLRRLNSEFAHYVPEQRQKPVLDFKPFADPEFFPKGIKHRYTRKPLP